jgi:hypothetical protein
VVALGFFLFLRFPGLGSWQVALFGSFPGIFQVFCWGVVNFCCAVFGGSGVGFLAGGFWLILKVHNFSQQGVVRQIFLVFSVLNFC